MNTEPNQLTSETLHPATGHHHEIHFFLDGEPQETDKHKDPATHYLVRIEAHRRISYQGKGEEPIKLHDGERFQIVSTGPTPVS